MRVSIGDRLGLTASTATSEDEEGKEILHLLLDVETDWGPIRVSFSTRGETLKNLLVWARSNYGTLAYDFVLRRSRSPLLDLVEGQRR